MIGVEISYIACFVVDLSPVVQQGVLQNHSLRQEEREARSLFAAS